MNDYAKLLHTIGCMDNGQLNAMFEDLVELAGIEKIEQIAEQAHLFTEVYEEPDDEDYMTEYEEWRATDNARRYREWKLDKGRIY